MLTKDNPEFVGLEFDYYETIMSSQLKFWTDLRGEVQKEDDDQRSHQSEIRALLNPSNPNVNPRVAITGIFGLDCEHGCKSEIHPVLALAIETNQDPNDNTWVMFVRNWGDEGFCSDYRHLIQFPNNVVSLLLFDGDEVDGPTVITGKTHMFGSGGANVPFPTISYWQSRGPVLSFTLPDPTETLAYVEFEVHFKWNRFSARACTPPAAPALKNMQLESADAEGYLSDIRRKLIEKNGIGAVHNALSVNPTTTLSEVPIPKQVAIGTFSPPTRPSSIKRRLLTTDKNQAMRDIKNIQDLCQNYGNKLPLYQGKDLSGELCDERKLNHELLKNQTTR